MCCDKLYSMEGLSLLCITRTGRFSIVRLFEFGNCYFFDRKQKNDTPLGKYDEQNHLSVFLTGRAQRENWNAVSRKVDIYDLKGFTDNILLLTGIPVSSLELISDTSGIFSQGMAYRMGNRILVKLGSLSPVLLKKFDLRQDVFYADFNWSLSIQLPESR